MWKDDLNKEYPNCKAINPHFWFPYSTIYPDLRNSGDIYLSVDYIITFVFLASKE